MRLLRLIGVFFVLAACGGSTASTTAPGVSAEVTSPTAAVDATTQPDTGEVALFSDLPAECVEALSAYLKAIEPLVEGIDWENATMADMEAIGDEMTPISDEFATQVELCPTLDTNVGGNMQDIIAFAEQEAPGTVGFWEFWLRFSAESTTATAASGDCETDIERFMVYVDAGGTMKDLTISELTNVGVVMTAIATECSAERSAGLFGEPEVEAFLNG
jgi:hypothetical protein